MDELSRKVDLLERRITLLERALARSSRASDFAAPSQVLLAQEWEIGVDDPNLVYVGAHKIEHDGAGEKFVWLGSKDNIQLVLPPLPVRKAVCHLLLTPHPAVTLEGMAVYVNDRASEYKFEPGAFSKPNLSFEIEEPGRTPVNVVIAGVNSIRPADLGENDDNRWLAFMFWGCKVVP